MKQETFQAEVTQLLDLMIHSLYSHKEIFLRELISNASDAIDKRKFEGLTNDSLKSDTDPIIRLTADKTEKILTISDNGIGMSYDEVKKNLGTIAHSGTKAFLQNQKDIKDNPELIGQFGVGFYSSFMVAEKVRVHTQKAGELDGTIWESKGKGSFEIDKKARPEGAGTTVTLYLKPTKTDSQASEDKEQSKDSAKDYNDQDYTQQWDLQTLIKKYSDFIAYPIKMLWTSEEPELDKDGKPVEGKTKTTTEDRTLNSQQALWLKNPSEIKEDEYKEFYRHLTHDWTDPLKHIHYRAEGTIEFNALLYLPSQRPWNYDYRDVKHGLSLYVKRVFIMADCEALIPPYLRFMKGMIDSSDLSLNVSREILQKDRQVRMIQKSLTGKILNFFKDTLASDRKSYETFWTQFGPTLKEGIPSDAGNLEKLQNLILFKSTGISDDKWTTLQEYVDRMKPDQKDIYFLTGDSVDRLKNSAYLEQLKAKGFEVILMTDPIDEFVSSHMAKYKDHNFVSVTSDNLELEKEESKEKEEKFKTAKDKLKPLLDEMQIVLKEEVKEIKLSKRLIDSPVCLVSAGHDPSARMERLMSAMGQDAPKTKRVLEINAEHPLFEKMLAATKERQKEWTEILYNQALLNEGSPIDNPLKFSKQIASLMVDAAK